jgi:hypothetical protein
LFHAIEPLAELYVAPPGSPIKVWAGPTGEPSTSRVKVEPETPRSYPIETAVGFLENDLSLATVRSSPRLVYEFSVPGLAAVVKISALTFCTTDDGFVSRSVKPMVNT